MKSIKSIKIISTIGKEELQKTVSMSLKPPTKIDLHKSFNENDTTNKPISRKVSLSSITIIHSGRPSGGNRQAASLLTVGEGSLGCVYKAKFCDQKIMAAFRSHPSDLFVELVVNISKLNHPNLAELVGYCSEHGQCLLAYEFYRNGSLHDFICQDCASTRVLEYLHETCPPSAVHQNFKSSNILLDDE